jgi:hypothetical protein
VSASGARNRRNDGPCISHAAPHASQEITNEPPKPSTAIGDMSYGHRLSSIPFDIGPPPPALELPLGEHAERRGRGFGRIAAETCRASPRTARKPKAAVALDQADGLLRIGPDASAGMVRMLTTFGPVST